MKIKIIFSYFIWALALDTAHAQFFDCTEIDYPAYGAIKAVQEHYPEISMHVCGSATTTAAIEGFLNRFDNFELLQAYDSREDRIDTLNSGQLTLQQWTIEATIFDQLPVTKIEFYNDEIESPLDGESGFDLDFPSNPGKLILVINMNDPDEVIFSQISNALQDFDVSMIQPEDQWEPLAMDRIFRAGHIDFYSPWILDDAGLTVEIDSYQRPLYHLLDNYDDSQLQDAGQKLDDYLKIITEEVAKINTSKHQKWWPSIVGLMIGSNETGPALIVHGDGARNRNFATLSINLAQIIIQPSGDQFRVWARDQLRSYLPEPPVLRVFLTGQRYPGNFAVGKGDPQQFADDECNRLAKENNLGGDYQAALGTSNKTMKQHLGNGRRGAYYATIDQNNKLYPRKQEWENFYTYGQDTPGDDGKSYFKVIGVEKNPSNIQTWNGPIEDSDRDGNTSCNNFTSNRVGSIIGSGSYFNYIQRSSRLYNCINTEPNHRMFVCVEKAP